MYQLYSFILHSSMLSMLSNTHIISLLSLSLPLSRYLCIAMSLTSDLQRNIYMLNMLVCVTLAVRAVDPLNLRRILPPVVSQLAYEIGTSSLLSSLIFLIKDWLHISLKVTGRRSSIDTVNRLTVVLHAFTWLSFNSLGALQVTVDPIWMWRSIKLLAGALILTILAALLARHGGMIYLFLRKQESLLVSRGGTSTSASALADSVDMASVSEMNVSTEEVPTDAADVQTRSRSESIGRSRSIIVSSHKRNRVRRILYLIALTLVCIIVCTLSSSDGCLTSITTATATATIIVTPPPLHVLYLPIVLLVLIMFAYTYVVFLSMLTTLLSHYNHPPVSLHTRSNWNFRDYLTICNGR
jgi:hypothetical protein